MVKSGLIKTIYRYINKDCPFTFNIKKSLKKIRLIKLRYYTYLISTFNNWRERNNTVILSNNPLNIGLFIDNLKAKASQLRNQKLRLNSNSISQLAA